MEESENKPSVIRVPLECKVSPLPCPFCGKLPAILPSNPKADGDAWARVICVNKKCNVNPFVEDGEQVADNRGSAAYKQAAIKRWNVRANAS